MSTSDTSALNFMGQPRPDPDHVGLGPTLLGVTWTLTGVAILAVALRLYLRRKFLGKWTAEDGFMTAALAIQIAVQGVVTEAVRWGFGKEYANLTLEDYMHVQKMEFIVAPLTYFVEMFARAAITLLLARIFGITRVWFKWFAVVLTTLIWVTGVGAVVLWFVQVRPMAAFWDPRIKPTYKMSQYVLSDEALVFRVLICLSDLFFVVFPVAFVWNVKMQLKRKVGLVLLFSAGLITTGVQAASIGLAVRGIMGKIVFQEVGYIGAVFYIVSLVEQSVVITMGCLPTLGPITQIDFSRLPVVSSIARSFTSLLSKGGSIRRSGSSDGGNSISYQKDLEIRREAPRGSPSDIEKGMGSSSVEL